MASSAPNMSPGSYGLEAPLISSRNHGHRQGRHMGGALTSIWLATAAIALPMFSLSAVLLCLTFYYKLDQDDPWFRSTSSANASSDTSAYYLAMSSTRFVTVASWSSNVAPHLSTFILVLFSYQVAKIFRSSLQGTATTQFPTSFQLGLLLQASSGGLNSLLHLGKYRLWPKRQALPATVKSTYWVLSLALLLGFGQSHSI